MKLLEIFADWRYRRRRHPYLQRRQTILTTLLHQVIPSGTPYQFDVALSFLQPGQIDPTDPVRLALFLHTAPLAIDVLGPESRPAFAQAERLLSRPDWERRQRQLAFKRQALGAYGCPYLVIWDDEPVDPVSLTERIRALRGSYL
jgi:hypothetical protein